MGDPKKQRRKYSKPQHPWQRVRIDEEKIIVKEYGLKNKKEIWRMASLVSNFSTQVKRIIAAKSKQADLEKSQLMKRLTSLGLLKENAQLDDVLGLATKDIAERRLQTLVHRKGLAKSMKQARQFIVHGHIKVGERQMTVPAYLVKKVEEDKISFDEKSSIASMDHPERVAKKPEAPKKMAPKAE
jgi:small subunit ribosomal protein S4